MTPTPAKLADEIEALAKEATQAPWDIETESKSRGTYLVRRLSENTFIPAAQTLSLQESANAALIVALVNNRAAIVSALREVDALKEEVERLRAQDWQPIETAPRDGTPLLLYRPWYDKQMDAGYPGAIWHSGGWGKSAFPGDTFRGEATYGKPTHWRPLPAPPSSAALGGGG